MRGRGSEGAPEAQELCRKRSREETEKKLLVVRRRARGKQARLGNGVVMQQKHGERVCELGSRVRAIPPSFCRTLPEAQC